MSVDFRDSMGSEIVRALEAAGIDTAGAHRLRYYLYFSAEEDAQAACTRLEGEGFDCVTAPSDDGITWLCLAKHTTVIDSAALTALGRHLTALAAELGGELDGWERESNDDDHVHPALAMIAALEAYESGELDMALPLLEQVVREPSEMADQIRPLLGLTLLKLERWKEGAAVFAEVLRLDPEDSSSRINYAIALQRSGAFEEAVRNYRAVLDTEPQNATAHYNLACAYAEQHRSGEALSELARSIEIEHRYRDVARSDDSFRLFRGDSAFEALTRTA